MYAWRMWLGGGCLQSKVDTKQGWSQCTSEDRHLVWDAWRASCQDQLVGRNEAADA